MTSIEFLQSQFDKIYVLTIPRMVERHQLLAKALSGLQYELCFGIDKSDLNINIEAEKGNNDNNIYLQHNKDGQSMRTGAYCCAYGHRAIYQHIQANNVQKALILEDDAILNHEHLNQLQYIFQQLPKTWELLYLGYEKNDTYNLKQKLKSWWYQIFPSHALLKLTPKQYKKYYAQPFTKNLWYAGFHDCTHAYAITLAGAQKMIELQSPIKLKSDSLLAYGVSLGLLESYISKPKIFDQLSIHQNSEIQSLVTD